MTPAIIKMFVITYDITIIVLRQAMMFASRSEDPDFAPNALAHSLHISVPLQQLLI